VTHTLQAFAFSGIQAEDFTRFAEGAAGTRYCNGAGCLYGAAVLLPAGALVTEIELSACDENPSASVSVALFRAPSPDGPEVNIALVSTGSPDTPGCVFRSGPVGPPDPVDNFANVYYLRVFVSGSDIHTRFQAVRLFYTLQVSPAPAVATFDDVPTSHPFFQVIEALSESGITAGCNASPPLYCPNSPVTRAQMAAFLSVALGLHWR
jgi:hypothetical protein